MPKGIKILLLVSFLAAAFLAYKVSKKINTNATYTVGQPLDSLNGVLVYYNGGVDNVEGRSLTADGYNLGLKYQCVEFVKRYYYEYYHHKMPDSYGHAKSFFDKQVADGKLNKARDLGQFENGSSFKPEVGDLLVFDGHVFNRYGHVAIVSKVEDGMVEIIQQNPGPFQSSRVQLEIREEQGKWTYLDDRVLGWLRKGPF